jgi:hypothetical protein
MEAARKTCHAVAAEYLDGKATVEQVNAWSRRWMTAERDTSKKPQDQYAALEAHIGRLKQLEAAAQSQFEKKRAPASDASAAEYHRLDAELELSRAKNK